MNKISTSKASIHSHLYSLIVPEEILKNFTVKEILENEEELLIVLVEQETSIPITLHGKEVVSNGYMNSTTLHHYPLIGKKCYLNLHRRRWKEKSAADTKSYHNQYDYTAEGTLATKSFGDFLKRNCLISTPSVLAQQVSLQG